MKSSLILLEVWDIEIKCLLLLWKVIMQVLDHGGNYLTRYDNSLLGSGSKIANQYPILTYVFFIYLCKFLYGTARPWLAFINLR